MYNSAPSFRCADPYLNILKLHNAIISWPQMDAMPNLKNWQVIDPVYTLRTLKIHIQVSVVKDRPNKSLSLETSQLKYAVRKIIYDI